MAVSDVLAQALARPLAALRTRWQASAGPSLYAAWIEALALWLPARWRQRLRAGDSRILLRADADGWRLLDPAAAHAETLLTPAQPLDEARWPRERARWLLLPEAQVLRRELSLPLAAADRLRDVVRHQIDRETPFSAEQVAFDVRLLARDDRSRKLRVELVLMPLTALNTHLERARALAGAIHGVDVDVGGTALGVNLLPESQRQRRFDPTLRLNLILVGITLAALLFAGWQSLANREAAVARLQAEVETQRQAARRAAALRERLDTAVSGARFLADARAARPRSIDLLNDLSQRLPDGTWLERLNITENRVVLIGYSNQASAQVALLQGSPYLRAPALSGSVQPDPRTGRDRFTITADLVTGPVTGGGR